MAAAVGAFVTSIMSPPSNLLFGPQLSVDVNYQEQGNKTLAVISISNNGLKQSTDLRITINPQFNIVGYNPSFYTEKINFTSTGPKSLLATMPRLASGTFVVIDTLLNGTKDSLSSYYVFITSNEGSATYSKDMGIPPYVATLFAMILSVALFIIQRLRRRI